MKDQAAHKAWEDLKEAVSEQVLIVKPDYNAAADYRATHRPFELAVDASALGDNILKKNNNHIHLIN